MGVIARIAPEPVVLPEPPDYAGLDAIRDLMSDAVDGDWFEDSNTGKAFRCKKPSGTRGCPVTPRDYERITGYVLKGSDEAYFTKADDEDTDNDVTGRGWVDGSSNNGTFTKVGDSHGVFNSSTTSAGHASLSFAPTTRPTNSVIYLKVRINMGTGSNVYAWMGVNGSNHYVRVGFTGTTQGDAYFQNSGASRIGDGEVASGSGWAWLRIELQGDASTSICRIEDLEGDELATIERADCTSGASNLSFNAYNSGASQHIGHIEECHWFTFDP